MGTVEQNMVLRATQLRRTLAKLGASFVKIGQALSARPDLLPKPYLEVSRDPQLTGLLFNNRSTVVHPAVEHCPPASRRFRSSESAPRCRFSDSQTQYLPCRLRMGPTE